MKKPSKATAPTDPQAEREAQKYDQPIASREFILAVMAERDVPMRFTELADALGIHNDSDLFSLQKRVKAMQRDGQLILGRRGALGLPKKMDLVKCKIIGHRDGYGFASPTEGGDDFFLSSRQMYSVFDGDEVLVAQSRHGDKGRHEGQVVEVLTRAHTHIVGRYMEEGGIGYLLPHNRRISNHVLIPPKLKRGAKSGQLVSVKLTDYPTEVLGAKGEVEEILGDHLDPGLEIDVAIRAHDIPYEWPDAVLSEVGVLRDEPTDSDKQNRVDLRHLGLVTIDGEDARDFDDAVYCEPEGSGFRVWVAIADVGHYVQIGTALDEEAFNRGNSVYFPERVVPMFPEVLSNGLCSLKPEVDRLAMVCEMVIDAKGQVADSSFYEAVIHSHARLTYTQVGEALENGWHEEVHADQLEGLFRLHSLYKVLREARSKRGAIDFETVETRILFDGNRKIDAIVPVNRNDAHKLIEECMLAANVATAAYLEASELAALFRVHEGPSAERLEALRTFLGELALDMPGGMDPTPLDYQSVLSRLEERDDAQVIQTMLLRSLSQAVYKPDNGGHFGLNYEAYTHFTSPIRRYPDLLVHRAIKRLATASGSSPRKRLKDETRALYPYTMTDLVTAGEHCSMTERRADDATRDVQLWLKCEYLRHHIGDEFAGVVASVTRFGMFVELTDIYMEGLVHISALPSDYYHYDQASQRLVGEHTRKTYQLGDAVRVQVARVDLDDRKIDLELVSAVTPGAGRQGNKSSIRARKARQDSGNTKRGKAASHSDRRSDVSESKSYKTSHKSASASKKKSTRSKVFKNKGAPKRRVRDS
ncbi:MAG: ribonuclease R [Pseudomonadota bacterium]|nr:ribonuclease R [Pseudomonadota bacterium]